MSDLAQFPSQGDLLKFVYNATGVIPSKKQFIVDFDINNKSLHKSLDRLAKEEGSFFEKFNTYANEFRLAIHGIFSNSMYGDTLFDPLIEIFQVYTQTVLTDHTYLNKKESLSFLINTAFLQRATVSIFKYTQYYSAFSDASLSPKSNFWFLTYENMTPLACVMNWIYDCEDKNLEVFHDISKSSANECIDQTDKDLANVRNWLSGTVKLPSFSNVLDVFNRAFKTHKIDDDTKDRYIYFLFIARFATYCLNSLVATYGEKEVTQILNKLELYLGLIDKDYKQLCSVVESNRTTELTDKESSMGKSYTKMQNVDFFLDKTIECRNSIIYQLSNIQSKYIKESSKNIKLQDKSIYEIHQEVLERLSASSIAPDKFIIKSFQDSLVPPNDEGYTENIENCIHGYDVMKQKYGYQKWLDKYYEVGNDIVYPWLVHWVDGINFFHNKEFENSIIEMRQAFNNIRYSAGNYQIKFIEDYMLVALSQPNKNGNVQGWKDFKVAFKWGIFMNNFDAFPAFYSNIDDENLKTMFEDNKKVFSLCSKNTIDTKILSKLIFHWKYDKE